MREEKRGKRGREGGQRRTRTRKGADSQRGRVRCVCVWVSAAQSHPVADGNCR